MSDLTDEEIADWLACFPTVSANAEQRDMKSALLELVRHRSALAADRERVRIVVRTALDELTEGWSYIDRAHAGPAKDAIATRAAEQWATAGAGLSGDERSDLESLLEELADRREVSISRGRFVDADVLRDQHAALAKLLGASK